MCRTASSSDAAAMPGYVERLIAVLLAIVLSQFWGCDKNTPVAILLNWHDVGYYLHRLAIRQIVPVNDVPAATVFDAIPNLLIFSWSKFRQWSVSSVSIRISYSIRAIRGGTF